MSGWGSLCFSSVSATTTRTAQPVRSSPSSAVVPSETMRSLSLRAVLTPAHSGTVSRCGEQEPRPGVKPGRSTIRLPVSVGTGMRLLASSKRIAEAGTPAFFNASLTAAAILASLPVTLRRKGSSGALPFATSTRSAALAMALLSTHSGWLDQMPHGSPSACQMANSTVHSTNIQTT